ncbi:hypothetical protein DFQ28_004970 [Apophysomyces sp. BC1034]|nr:hypothetical protein DFQ28_004970 [Apophysomyces sp. BC1034]
MNTENKPHGLLTPESSQDVTDETVSKRAEEAVASPIKTHDVEWLDTDTSEDEDFLPQNHHQRFPSPPRKSTGDERKRSRMDSVTWCEPRELARRRLEYDETPTERARRIIDEVIDNGTERVDLGHLGLTDIPEEISELQYMTILRKDTNTIKTAALEVFLYGNTLSCLNQSLFKLKNLAVLSLTYTYSTRDRFTPKFRGAVGWEQFAEISSSRITAHATADDTVSMPQPIPADALRYVFASSCTSLFTFCP